MTLKRSSQILITLLLATTADAQLYATRTKPNNTKATINITRADQNQTVSDTQLNANTKRSPDLNPEPNFSVDYITRALAPTVAGGVIVTPAFQYAIKSSDFATPTASWTAGATPPTGATMYSINTSGRYYVATDIAARINNSYTNTVMLYINCSNVILDLNSKSLYPAGNTTNQNTGAMTAIMVAPNVSNVVITNGQINGYQPNNSTPTSYLSHGIVVSSGCSNITINALTITNIGGDTAEPNTTFNVDSMVFADSILLLGASGSGNAISNVDLQNINIANTVNAYGDTDADVNAAALALTYCNNIRINDCNFNGSSAVGEDTPPGADDMASYGVYMSNSSTINFKNCAANQNGINSINSAYGFLDINSTAVSFSDCAANSTNGYNTIGFSLGSSGGGPYNLVDCTSSNSTATQGTYGFHVSALATLRNCVAESNAAGALGAVGICLDSAISNNGSSLINCQANRNSSTDLYAYGIYVYNCNGATLDGCMTTGNVGVATQVAGIYIEYGDSCQIKNCCSNENSSTTPGLNVFGMRLTQNDGCLIDNCSTSHNFNTAGAPYVIGLYLELTNGTQVTNCQSRNNTVSNESDGLAAGFYSYSGSANQFYNCQAINNSNNTAAATGAAAGIVIDTEANDQITNCNCSANTISTSATGVGYGIYLLNNSTNTLVRNCDLNFNVGALNFGFYDDTQIVTGPPASASSSVLINNRAIGQGRCFPITSSYEFATDTSMNYFFYTLGDIGEDPNNMINETDNYNWKVLSTAVPNWSNISVVIGQIESVNIT